MKPGKPSAFGHIAGTPFFGLPGNPVSVFVSFEQFVRPAVLSMLGAVRHFRPRVPGVMAASVRSTGERQEFVRVTVEHAGGEWVARPSGGQGSHVLSALAAADAFAVIPAGVDNVDAGAPVELEMFRWPEIRTAMEVLGE
jgi:molybdopterin molybdotransferase